MARNERSRLKITLEIDQATGKLIKFGSEVDKLKQKTTSAAAGQAQLQKAVQQSGQAATTAAVNFQTMSQGFLNLSTSMVQTATSFSNLDRAAHRYQMASIAVARAEDLRNAKQLRLNELQTRGLGNTQKAINLTKELTTAEADLTAKLEKERIEQGAVNDVYMLFFANIANVGFSTMQTVVALLGQEKAARIANVVVMKLQKVLHWDLVRAKYAEATATAVTAKATLGYAGALRTAGVAMKSFMASNPILMAGMIASTGALVAYETNFLGLKDAINGVLGIQDDYIESMKDTRKAIEDVDNELSGLSDTFKFDLPRTMSEAIVAFEGYNNIMRDLKENTKEFKTELKGVKSEMQHTPEQAGDFFFQKAYADSGKLDYKDWITDAGITATSRAERPKIPTGWQLKYPDSTDTVLNSLGLTKERFLSLDENTQNAILKGYVSGPAVLGYRLSAPSGLEYASSLFQRAKVPMKQGGYFRDEVTGELVVKGDDPFRKVWEKDVEQKFQKQLGLIFPRTAEEKRRARLTGQLSEAASYAEPSVEAGFSPYGASHYLSSENFVTQLSMQGGKTPEGLFGFGSGRNLAVPGSNTFIMMQEADKLKAQAYSDQGTAQAGLLPSGKYKTSDPKIQTLLHSQKYSKERLAAMSMGVDIGNVANVLSPESARRVAQIELTMKYFSYVGTNEYFAARGLVDKMVASNMGGMQFYRPISSWTNMSPEFQRVLNYSHLESLGKPQYSLPQHSYQYPFVDRNALPRAEMEDSLEINRVKAGYIDAYTTQMKSLHDVEYFKTSGQTSDFAQGKGFEGVSATAMYQGVQVGTPRAIRDHGRKMVGMLNAQRGLGGASANTIRGQAGKYGALDQDLQETLDDQIRDWQKSFDEMEDRMEWRIDSWRYMKRWANSIGIGTADTQRQRDAIRMETASTYATQLPSVSTTDAFKMIKDELQGEQTLIDMLAYQQRLEGMSTGVV